MKAMRHAMILQLIDGMEIDTQEMLADQLLARGVSVTQATISRDIKELRLVKALSSSGKYYYTTSVKEAESSFSGRLRNIFRECVTNIDSAQNMVVIKTLPGLGGAAAMAIDSMKIPNVVGTLGGDDTVFVVMRDTESALELADETRDMLK